MMNQLYRSRSSMLLWKTRLSFATALIVSVVFVRGDFGTGFRVSGVITHQALGVNSATNVTAEAKFAFSVDLMDKKWLMTVGTGGGSYYEYASDSTNIVELFHDSSAPQHKLPAVLHGAGYPAEGQYGNLVWLAFASSDFLRADRSLPAPWLNPRHDPKSFGFRTEIERFTSEPELPSAVRFITDSNSLKRAPKSEMLNMEGVPWRVSKQEAMSLDRIPGNLLACDYRVLDSKLVGNFRIPTQFELRVFRAHTNEFQNPVMFRIIGNALTWEVITNQVLWPKSDAPGVSVTDRRFRVVRQGIDCIQYNITNEWILDAGDFRLLKLFAEKRKKAPFLRLAPFGQYAVYSIFVSLCLVPPVVLWWRSRKGNRSTSKPKTKG